MVSEARFPWVVFGDGQFAQLLKIRYGLEDKEGVRICEVKLRLTDDIIYFHKIDTAEIDPRDNSITRRYQENFIVPLNDDPTTGLTFIMCDFYGSATRMTNLFTRFLQTIEGMQKERKALKAENAFLHEKITKTTSQEERHTNELVRKVAPLMKLRGDLQNMQVDQPNQSSWDQGG